MKRKLGFSLTEVLVSIVILGILMTSMGLLFINTRKAVVKTLAKKEAENHISETMDCFCSTVYSTDSNKADFLRSLMGSTLKPSTTDTYLVGYDSSFEQKEEGITSGNYIEYKFTILDSVGERTYKTYTISIDVYLKNELFSSLSTKRSIVVDIL